MSFTHLLQRAQAQNQSLLCVGLDPDPAKFPTHLKGDASRIYDFCAAIIEATADLVIAFKPQIAYFAAHRAEDQLERLMAHIKRYLKHHGKGAFLLCRTSNPGGDDFQNQRLASVDGQPRLFEHIARLAQGPWNTNGELGLVVGATYPAEIERVRALAPTLPLLIPGVGAQGGDAVATVRAGLRTDAAGAITGPVVVNSSRAILYASSGDDFAAAARQEALRTRALLASAASKP